MTIQKTGVFNFQAFEGIKPLPFPISKLHADQLRHALNQRIRHGKSRLRKRLRRNRWSSVLKHPALIAMVGNMIRERAAQPPLFPLMFENLVVREVRRDP